MKPILMAILLLSASSVLAQSVQNLAEVEQAAYRFLLHEAQLRYDRPQITVDRLDPRLRLQACSESLQAFTPRSGVQAGAQTIGVRCPSGAQWSVYVTARVRVFETVVVTSKSLSANHVLTAEDLRLEAVDIAGIRQGLFAQVEPLVGQQLRQPVAMGAVLSPNQLRAVATIRRGESVLLVAALGNMQVRMQGVAMADAQIGDRVRVKNNSSERIVEGVVTAPGIVQVTM